MLTNKISLRPEGAKLPVVFIRILGLPMHQIWSYGFQLNILTSDRFDTQPLRLVLPTTRHTRSCSVLSNLRRTLVKLQTPAPPCCRLKATFGTLPLDFIEQAATKKKAAAARSAFDEQPVHRRGQPDQLHDVAQIGGR